jgi:hypothetical protein
LESSVDAYLEHVAEPEPAGAPQLLLDRLQCAQRIELAQR